MRDVWKRQCSARAKATGKQCKRWAIRGARTCIVHGSATKAARAKAARTMQTHLASQYAQQLGASVEVHPLEALLAALHQSAGVVAFWRLLVGELAPAVGDAMVEVDDPFADDSTGITRRSERRAGVAGPDHLGDVRPHVFVTQYQDAIERLARIGKMALEAGVEERQVRLAERQGELMVQVIRGVFGDMQIPMTPAAIEIVGRHLALAASTFEVVEVDR